MTNNPGTTEYGTLEERAELIMAWPQQKRRRWILQNCYFGHGQMLGKSMRHLIKEGVEQIETVYFCECGYSLTQYVPRSLAVTIIDEECFPPPLQAQ